MTLDQAIEVVEKLRVRSPLKKMVGEPIIGRFGLTDLEKQAIRKLIETVRPELPTPESGEVMIDLKTRPCDLNVKRINKGEL